MPMPPPPQLEPAGPLDEVSRVDDGGWPLAVRPPAGEPLRLGDAGGTVASRRCGRCLAMFPGDPGVDPVALPEWWLCPPCRLALLGDGPRRPATPATPATPPPPAMRPATPATRPATPATRPATPATLAGHDERSAP